MCNANCKDEDKDGNATGAYSSSSSSARSAMTMASKREWSLADKKDYAPKKRPSWVAKKTVSYCDTSESELEFDENGYERSKTKSFNKKANATDSDIDEFELGPDADDEDDSIAYDTMLSEMESAEDGDVEESMDFDEDSSSEMEFDADSSSEMEFDYFIVRSFDDAAKKADMILNNTLARMKKLDKGPTAESETAYLVTMKSEVVELFRLGYGLVFALCKCDDLGRHVTKHNQ
jgi:hypothetical protein